MNFTHLRRDSRVALELAIVELAPNDLLDRLALGPGTMDRARSALKAWHAWADGRKKLA